MEIKKKLKDITLKDVKLICNDSQKHGGCESCPFYDMHYGKVFASQLESKRQGIVTFCYCPYEVEMPDFLEEKLVWIEVDE